ncbi:hypothetical protein E8F20_00100 [Pseudomonas sp. BN415]|uniref:hypothetical protein n=1 Tax=Pseudomonas sp. BN415 TaxID=2567889 RepID=UPI0024588A61|nr:hypothetical protein [Pseudomonas sp. BN415]MDH4580270.1 hypothetical protein [Pseudomonas sp. BN415]
MNRQLYVWINVDQVGVLAESNGLSMRYAHLAPGHFQAFLECNPSDFRQFFDTSALAVQDGTEKAL